MILRSPAARSGATAARLQVTCSALATAALLLTGCAAETEPAEQSPASDPSAASESVDERELGTALGQLLHHSASADPATPASQRCLVEAMADSDVSPAAKQQLIDSAAASPEWAQALQAVHADVSADDAELLAAADLRTAFDSCLLEAAGVDVDDTDDTADESASAADHFGADDSAPVPERERSKPNLTPSQEIDPELDITAASVLEPGLVVMFSSYVDGDDAKRISAHQECLAEAIFTADFSQDTLRFIAGGPPLGAGSIADHLPHEDDRALWRSAAFTASLSTCLH